MVFNKGLKIKRQMSLNKSKSKCCYSMIVLWFNSVIGAEEDFLG